MILCERNLCSGGGGAPPKLSAKVFTNTRTREVKGAAIAVLEGYA